MAFAEYKDPKRVFILKSLALTLLEVRAEVSVKSIHQTVKTAEKAMNTTDEFRSCRYAGYARNPISIEERKEAIKILEGFFNVGTRAVQKKG